jgi:hypothetical protein
MKHSIHLLALASIGMGISLHTNATDNRFFNALHQVESSGRTGRVIGDNGKALGPLQIHREYFQDAAEVDPSLGKNYNQVTDLEFSKRVVTAYLKRYAPTAVNKKDFETLARIHNGGPRGHKNPATVGYWNKVRKNLN